jgi:GNAT superfamily N-acetyltransferase
VNGNEILTLYDKEQRREIGIYKGRIEVLPELIRHIYDDPKRNSFIVYSSLTEANADAVIEREIAYFRELGRRLEWKAYDHDTLPNLPQRLIAHGFVLDEEPGAIMALDLHVSPPMLLEPVTADVRRILDPALIDDVMAVEEAVWDTDFSWLKQEMLNNLRERPEEIAIYVAYVDNRPVSSGWIFFHHHSHFASIWGGSTLEAYRKQGFYTALVAARAQEAIRRGYRFLTIDAGPMSRPIVARNGFQLLTIAHECSWTPANGE